LVGITVWARRAFRAALSSRVESSRPVLSFSVIRVGVVALLKVLM
jgi:hypothetical protein